MGLKKASEQFFKNAAAGVTHGMVLEEARRVQNSHPDFAVSKSWLQETVDKLGAELIFYPKFHCELNFIEMIFYRPTRVNIIRMEHTIIKRGGISRVAI